MSNFFRITIVCSLIFFITCTPEPIDLDLKNRFGRLPESVIVPSDNPMTTQKIQLGKQLFWDPILSGNKDIACVSCHHPNHGYAENLDLSIGVGGEGLSNTRKEGVLVKRNSQTILNTAFNGIDGEGFYQANQAPMFWDSRSKSLEEQAIEPILSAEEMRGSIISEANILDTIINRLNTIPEYVRQFEEVFGEEGISKSNIGKSIAAFERTLIGADSRFDQYVAGDENAMTSLEIRGMLNFIEGGCVACHGGPMFSDYELHVLTVPENQKLEMVDRGDDNFAFRTPSLRNLAYTAPYMHNGVFNTLEEVIEFYDEVDSESQNPNISSSLRDVQLNQLDIPDDQKKSILAFLNSLNDLEFNDEIIKSVPSGLNPGGNID